MDDLDVIILDRLDELANKAAVLAAGLVRTGIDRPSMSAFVNLAWVERHEGFSFCATRKEKLAHSRFLS
jgi:hypothetical protein